MTPTKRFVVAISILISTAAYAQANDITLEDGRAVTIDSATQQATIDDSANKPLWDGVHRLNDGSVMIIQDGVVISGGRQTPVTQDPLNAPLASKTEYQISPCVQLSINTCGFNGQCKDSAACLTAKQLVNLELEEQVRHLNAVGDSTVDQCRKLLNDKRYFADCQPSQSENNETACSQLTSHVCGLKGECHDSEACKAAQQLLSMETEEIQQSRHRGRLTHSSLQCLEAVKNQDYFKQCTTVQKH